MATIRSSKENTNTVFQSTSTLRGKTRRILGVVLFCVFLFVILVGFPYQKEKSLSDGGMQYYPSQESLVAGCGNLSLYNTETLQYKEVKITSGQRMFALPDNIYKYPIGGYYMTDSVFHNSRAILYPDLVNRLRVHSIDVAILYSPNAPQDAISRVDTAVKSLKSKGVKAEKFAWNPQYMRGFIEFNKDFAFVSEGKYQACSTMSVPALNQFISSKTYKDDLKK